MARSVMLDQSGIDPIAADGDGRLPPPLSEVGDGVIDPAALGLDLSPAALHSAFLLHHLGQDDRHSNGSNNGRAAADTCAGSEICRSGGQPS